MGECVVADGVAGLDDLTDEIRTLLNVCSNQKKSCMNAVPGEHIQQPQRMWIVRSIVVSEGELARTGSQSGEGVPVPLSGWRHGLIARGNRGRGGETCRCQSEHGGIVLY